MIPTFYPPNFLSPASPRSFCGVRLLFELIISYVLSGAFCLLFSCFMSLGAVSVISLFSVFRIS